MTNSKDILSQIGTRTLIMGVLNVTPDSFSDGGRYIAPEQACTRALQMEKQGADIIDIGGESTRPGSAGVDRATELKRVLPVIESLEGRLTVPVSIDTTKAEVARKALDAGAGVLNDISAFRNDPEMADIAAEYDVPVVLMHMRGNPKDMQVDPHYKDVVAEIKQFFGERIKWAAGRGVKEERIILDPGIGFGKLLEHNLEILRRLGEFREFGRPILVGTSRKSFIGKILDMPPEHRIWGTAGSAAAAVMNGADIIRVHDVVEMRQVVAVVDAVIKTGEEAACRS